MCQLLICEVLSMIVFVFCILVVLASHFIGLRVDWFCLFHLIPLFSAHAFKNIFLLASETSKIRDVYIRTGEVYVFVCVYMCGGTCTIIVVHATHMYYGRSYAIAIFFIHRQPFQT